MDLVPHGVDDDAVEASRPLVRGLLVKRLEEMWGPVQRELDSGDPDPRFLELGVRIADRLIKLYRLLEPASSDRVVEVEGRAAHVAAIEGQVAELEVKRAHVSGGAGR